MKPKTATRIIGAFIDAVGTEERRIERDTYDVEMSKESLQSNMEDLSDLKKVKTLMEAGDIHKAIDILIANAKEKREIKPANEEYFLGIKVSDIYRSIDQSPIYQTLEELNKYMTKEWSPDFIQLHEWYIYSALAGLDVYDMHAYESVSCRDYYYDLIKNYWSMHDRKEARTEWLGTIVKKFGEPYYNDNGDLEQIVVIPDFVRIEYHFGVRAYPVAYRVNPGRFFE